MQIRRIINIDFKNLLSRLLPVHKRLPKRLMLFYWPFSILQELFETFRKWRYDIYYRLNVTGQTISLETYLNRIVDGSNGRILIYGYNDQGIWAQMSIEEGEAYMVPTGIAPDESYQEVAMEGEIIPLTSVDFYVFIPSTVIPADVARIVNRYKLAGKRYQIIQSNN